MSLVNNIGDRVRRLKQCVLSAEPVGEVIQKHQTDITAATEVTRSQFVHSLRRFNEKEKQSGKQETSECVSLDQVEYRATSQQVLT